MEIAYSVYRSDLYTRMKRNLLLGLPILLLLNQGSIIQATWGTTCILGNAILTRNRNVESIHEHKSNNSETIDIK